MSVLHLFRLALAIVLSAAAGWFALVALNIAKAMQRLEAFQASVPHEDFGVLTFVVEDAMRNMQGGFALFLAAPIAGVVLSEVFKTRSLVFYAGATGALAAALAAAGSGQPHGSASASLAVAGFISGFVYWLLAGQGAGRDLGKVKLPTER